VGFVRLVAHSFGLRPRPICRKSVHAIARPRSSAAIDKRTPRLTNTPARSPAPFPTLRKPTPESRHDLHRHRRLHQM
jgi:hypothetical protein